MCVVYVWIGTPDSVRSLPPPGDALRALGRLSLGDEADGASGARSAEAVCAMEAGADTDAVSGTGDGGAEEEGEAEGVAAAIRVSLGLVSSRNNSLASSAGVAGAAWRVSVCTETEESLCR